MRTIVKILIATVLSTAAPAAASTGAAWLGYSSSGANLAEAGGLGVMADGADSMGLNPAGLASLAGDGAVQAGYAQWPGQINVQTGQAALRTGVGVLGASVSWVDFGNINAYTVDPVNGVQQTGSMHPNASDVGLDLGSQVGRLALGLGAHLVTEDLVGQGSNSAPAVDAGARMDVIPSMTAAVSLINAGGSLDGSALPTALRTGLALRSPRGDSWEIGVEASTPLSGGQADLLGAFRYHVAAPLTLRAGWIQGQGISGDWSMGASFQMEMIGLDYGFRQIQGFDPINQVTVRVVW
ncbi:MAG TPA: hypothetical protein VNZ54_05570 [bacterium]|jgi:hypothetical protein|nr:hypothetical protein [bacterium]